MKISYGTDIGAARDENQDSVFVHSFSDDTALFIVADGMGGYEGGKLASTTAIEKISTRIISEYQSGMNSEEVCELLQMSIQDANTAIFEIARGDKRLSGTGTTTVVSIVEPGIVYTANVGDSRAYIFDGKTLSKITTDHSLVNDMLKRGLITPQEADTHPQRNVITRAVGSDVRIEVDTYVTNIKGSHSLLLCSDGLYSMVAGEQIEKILSKNTKEPAQKLIDLANKNGGRDNITVICAKFPEEVK